MNGYDIIPVEISPYLQLTKHGLALAIHKIPFQERRKYRAYNWGTVKEENGKRIANIIAYKRL